MYKLIIIKILGICLYNKYINSNVIDCETLYVGII